MPAWLLSPLVLRAIGALALVLIVAGLKHGYDERRRDEGRAEIREQWDADKAARLKAFTEMTTRWVTAQQEADANLKKLDTERQRRLDDAKRHALALPPADAGMRFPASAVGVLDDARNSDAETARPAGQPAGGPAAAAADSTVGLVTQWAVDVIGYYNACRDQVIGWQGFYHSLREQP